VIAWLKWRIASKELMTLERYRIACAEAERWLASDPIAAETAAWIRGRGEDSDVRGISRLRARLEMLKALPELKA